MTRFDVERYVIAEVVRAPVGGSDRGGSGPLLLKDVSATGIGFYAPADLGLEAHLIVTISISGCSSAVRLRWVNLVEGGDWVECGGAFLSTAPELVPALELALQQQIADSTQLRLEQLATFFGPPRDP